MTCRNCARWCECSQKDGTTKYYGKVNCAGNAEELCNRFESIAKNELKPRSAEQATCSANAELAEADVMRALELKVQRHLMPNVDIDGTVSVEDAERWFLKLLKEELAPYVSALLREKDALIEDYRQELGRARVALNDANVKIERLEALNSKLLEKQSKVRTEAVAEFVERLKSTLIASGIYPVIVKNSIKKIAEEMKGDQDA